MISKIATVSSVSGTDLSVIPDGSTTAIIAIDCCGAQADDRVVLEMHATQALAVAIVGGPHGGSADFIIDAGVSQGWYYQLYDSGRIRAFRVLGVSMDSPVDGYVITSVPLPATMNGTDYVVQVNPGIYKVSKAYDIYADRTVTTASVALRVDSAGGTTGVSLTLDGFVDGAVIPQGTRLPDYTGATSVTPRTYQQTLATQDTSVLDDITVFEIPRADTSNESGGLTVTIAGD